MIETLQASADFDNTEDAHTIQFVSLVTGITPTYIGIDLTKLKTVASTMNTATNLIVEHLRAKQFPQPIITDFLNIGMDIKLMYGLLEQENYLLNNRNNIPNWTSQFSQANTAFMTLKIDVMNLIETYQEGNIVDQNNSLESLFNELQK